MSISRSLTLLGSFVVLAGTAVCAPAARAGTVTGSVDGILTTGGTSTLDTHGYFGAVNASLIGQSVHIAFQYTTPFSESPINPTFGFGSATVTLAITVNGTTIGSTGSGNLVETDAANFDVQMTNGTYQASFSTTTPYLYGSLQTQAGMDTYLAGATGLGQIFIGDYINYTITGHSDAIPEPTTVGLLGLGATAIGLIRRRRARQG